MGVLEDMVKVLDRIPGWKRLQEVPAEVDQLKAQVAALEEKLGGKWPPDVCRFCGARAARLYHVYPGIDPKGNVREVWRCDECKREDDRTYRPSPRP